MWGSDQHGQLALRQGAWIQVARQVTALEQADIAAPLRMSHLSASLSSSHKGPPIMSVICGDTFTVATTFPVGRPIMTSTASKVNSPSKTSQGTPEIPSRLAKNSQNVRFSESSCEPVQFPVGSNAPCDDTSGTVAAEQSESSMGKQAIRPTNDRKIQDVLSPSVDDHGDRVIADATPSPAASPGRYVDCAR